MKTPRPPGHISKEMKAWWKEVVSTYELEHHHLHLLRLACESFDRANEARTVVDAQGMTFTNRHGEPCTRPEVIVEQHQRALFARLLRELDLDVEPSASARRPPAIRSNRTLGAI
jgi:P27 family predicted phage terminase small subunit